jgi:NADH-quinone oxidoreductase subunit C
MEQSSIASKVAEKFASKLVSSGVHAGQAFITVKPTDLVEILQWLRSEPGLEFNRLMDIGGVDLIDHPSEPEHRFEVVYQLLSFDLHHRFRVKVAVKDDTVSVPSLWTLWGMANWMEREVFDLFGIRFDGHPNMRRILCHEDFVGHALRKDYPIDKRQMLSRPVASVMTEKQEWA